MAPRPLRLERVSNFDRPKLSNFARSKSLTLNFGQQGENRRGESAMFQALSLTFQSCRPISFLWALANPQAASPVSGDRGSFLSLEVYYPCLIIRNCRARH